MIVTFDIETTSIPKLVLDIEKILCIAIKIDDNPTKCYTYKPIANSDGDLSVVLDILNKADLIIGHNITKFDIPIIEKFLGKITAPIVDTLIDAKLTYPKDILLGIDYKIPELPKALKGSYSLKAFGYRLGNYKLDYDDFTELNEDMVTYCKQDVEVTYALYRHLITRTTYPSKKVRELEYKVASIIFDQQEYGFYFDIDKARELATKLKFRQMNLEHALLKIFPKQFEPDGDPIIPAKPRTVKLRYRAYPKHTTITEFYRPLEIGRNGKYKYPPKSMKWLDYPYRIIPQVVSGEYQKIKLVNFNPNSRQQIAKRLISTFNWQPVNYTEKGNIKIDESILGETYEDNEDNFDA